MERVHCFIRNQAIKFSALGAIVAGILLIFGPALDLLFVEHADVVIAVSLAILIAVCLLLLDYLGEMKQLIKPPDVSFCPDQSASEVHLRHFIESEKPRKADLLEHSSITTYENIIKPLVAAGSEIRLLLQNPKMAAKIMSPSRRQERRICQHIASRLGYEPELVNYQKIKIRFYDQIASLRGRSFEGKLVNVGWLTYDQRPEEMSVKTDPVQIWGHTNALLSIRVGDRAFDSVQSMFDKVFSNLWSQAGLPINVCGNCADRRNGLCTVSDAWLAQISKDRENQACETPSQEDA